MFCHVVHRLVSGLNQGFDPLAGPRKVCDKQAGPGPRQKCSKAGLGSGKIVGAEALEQTYDSADRQINKTKLKVE